MSALFRIYIRNAANQRIAELTDWTSLDLMLRFNDVGTWTLETSSESREALLLTKTGGIIVTRTLDDDTPEEVIFSGFVWTEWGFTSTTFRASGYSDDAHLWVPCRPSPLQADPPFPDEYDVRTDQASRLMRIMVDVNIGPSGPAEWRVPGLTFPADPMLGSTITARARFQPLITLLAELAITPYAGGLGFYLRQGGPFDSNLYFVVYAPPDKSAEAKFGIELGTAQDYEDMSQAPEATHAFVLGGDGLGANRTVIAVHDDDVEAEWGRRISTVVDQRDVSDPSELNQKAAEVIAGAITRKRAAITPFDVPSLQYGVDYDLGTLVTIVTHSGETVDLIRQVEIHMDADRGVVITPIVGQGDGSDEERMATITRTIQNRVSNMERNWNIPPDSVDTSMLVPMLKPPIGEVKWLAGVSVPSGYLACNGASYLRSAYPDLFAEIGTIWGAADGTHFNVPDLRDRSPIGSGSTYTLGQLVGAATAVIGTHTHTGAAHTHPGSHSHGLSNHTHAGQTHTHPGSHSHGLAAHRHQMGHDHTVNIDHDHASFSSGKRNNDTVGALGFAEPAVSSGTLDHHHNVDVPSLGTTNITSSNSNNTVTGDGEKTSGGAAFTSSDTDSNVFAASYSGSPSTPSTNTSDSDSNVFSASFSGQTGAAGGSTTSIVHPSAGLLAVIYAGV